MAGALDYFNANRRQALADTQGMFDQATMRRAGGLLAGGDYTGAAGALYGGGLLSQGAVVQNMGESRAAAAAKAQKEAKEEAAKIDAAEQAERLKFLAQGATVLLSIPAEQRATAFQQSIAPALKAMGADDATIQQAGSQLDDASLQTFSGQVSKALEQFTLAPGSKRFDQSGRLVAEAPFAPEYKSVGAGETLVEINPGGGGPAGGGQPRNLRNNNPGNIEDGPFAKSLPGYKGSDSRFAIFETPEAGESAQTALLSSYGKRGFDTVEEIINRWAPPSDNNPTPAYVNFVAQKLGVQPGDKLNMSNPDTLRALAGAIKQFEGGGQSASNGPRVVAQGAPKAQKRERRMTPEEVKAAGYQPGSVVMVNEETGEETVKQGPGAGSGKITDGMRNVASLANDMFTANEQINGLAQRGIFRPTAQIIVSEQNGVTRLVARNPKDAQFVQAANSWLLPLLRKETGAAVTAPELQTYMDTYIPLPSDNDETVRQKATARRRKMLNMLQQSRPAFEDQFGEAPKEVVTYAPRKNKPAQRPSLQSIFGGR